MEIVFEELFTKNNWAPIEYNGKKISIGDTITLPSDKVKLTITFEEINSEWEQGIFLKGKGEFLFRDEKLPNAIYLWQSTSPKIMDFIFDSKDRQLKIWNIWRIDNGPMQYGHNGAALYYDIIPHGRRYFCNDGHPNDDFNDLIFTAEATPIIQ